MIGYQSLLILHQAPVIIIQGLTFKQTVQILQDKTFNMKTEMEHIKITIKPI